MEYPITANYAHEAYRFGRYASGIGIDIALGLAGGVLINASVMIMRKKFNIHPLVEAVIQIVLIVILLYVLSRSTTLHSFDMWDGPSSYGVVFVTAFLTSQSNVLRWFTNISKAEEDMVNQLFD